jgi:hypothetical protein
MTCLVTGEKPDAARCWPPSPCWTKLVPQGPAPSKYLVLVLRETITADGTVVPVFERAYLVCKQPKCSAERIGAHSD